MSKPVWSIGMTIDQSEKEIILQALGFFQYNKTMTAKSLGISGRGLDGKMDRHGIINKKRVMIEEEKRSGVVTDKSGKQDYKATRERDQQSA